jgi:excisionase family DNA binding protein
MKCSADQLSLELFQDEAEPVEERASKPARRPPSKPEEPPTVPGECGASPAAGHALLTTSEAAKALHVHVRTVQRLVERGELASVHLGSAVRFDPDDVAGLVVRLKDQRRPQTPTRDTGIRRAGRDAGVSFAERLRSQNHEHRAAQA